MATTPTQKNYESRAFAISLALHALLLLLIYFLPANRLRAPLEVAIMLESEPVEPHEIIQPEKQVTPRRRQSDRKAAPAHSRTTAKRASSARRDTRTLSDPWSDYEQKMFARKHTSEGSDRGKATASATSWGSENPGRTEKRSEHEQVTVPQGSSNSAMRWRKGSARRLISLPPIEYPESVRRKSGQGVVELLIEVDERGHVENVEIVKSSGITRLDLNARNAYRRAVFSPSATGESASGIVSVTFRMKDN